MVTSLLQVYYILNKLSCLRKWFVFWHFLGCLGHFSKNWAIFSKSSEAVFLAVCDPSMKEP
jgi:hypothetical protein